MTYSKKMMHIVQKLDAINGAVENIKKQKCGTETAKRLSSVLVKRLDSERNRLIHELELIANTKSIRAVGKVGLPVQGSSSRRHYNVGRSRQYSSQRVLH
ncbi:MAG: hypothetical protein HOL17_02280 [Gammaproteobacteria bacterium]|nr:hypothetical protein [Gammaproteobacteria bacterium]MBT4605492.1 hypothetical protein [Thiotrichales bacterium]MBT4079313.1 hypothetical protein [Gammaproteobacteria bacterium]MBT4331155.1 hypothetical protein [Gammaproteobacteria bacterium]MBT5370532.1 hypothetical protein [Gammaproteobacteria bacterium]